MADSELVNGNIVVADEVAGSKGSALKLPGASFDREASGEMSTAVDDVAIYEMAIPESVGCVRGSAEK
jgi:hypothetical protein